jgi:hypothetical protein
MVNNRGLAWRDPAKWKFKNIDFAKLIGPSGRKSIMELFTNWKTNICDSDQHVVRGRATAVLLDEDP